MFCSCTSFGTFFQYFLGGGSIFPFDTVHADLLSTKWTVLDILFLSNSDVLLQRTPGLCLLLTDETNSPFVAAHSCIRTYTLFMSSDSCVHIQTSIYKQVRVHLLCPDRITVSVCVFVWVCVSCWWYFPRALCYAGQLLHPSCSDSSAAPPGGLPPHTAL